MRRWILGFVSAVFGVSRLGAFGVLFLCIAFVPNMLYATTLPKALDSKEGIFVDGFYFYGGESEAVNCRVDSPNISEKELREMGIPKDAPLLYMGYEVCDWIKQSYFLANDIIADRWNDRDKRAMLPNQVLNIIDTKLAIYDCNEKPCIMNRVVGHFYLADRNEFAAIELLDSGGDLDFKSGAKSSPNADKDATVPNKPNTAKSSPNKSATSHTLGIIYKIFGYAGWQEAQSDYEVRIVPLPLNAFETHGFDGEDEILGHKSDFPKRAGKNGYGGYLTRESMLANTQPAIKQVSGTPKFNPMLLPSAYLGLRFASNIVLYATPEAVLKSRLDSSVDKNGAKSNALNAGKNNSKEDKEAKSSASNANKSVGQNRIKSGEVILEGIYHNAKTRDFRQGGSCKRGGAFKRAIA